MTNPSTVSTLRDPLGTAIRKLLSQQIFISCVTPRQVNLLFTHYTAKSYWVFLWNYHLYALSWLYTLYLNIHPCILGHTLFRLSMAALEPSSRSTTSMWLFCTPTWRAPSSWNQVKLYYQILVIIAEILFRIIFSLMLFLNSLHAWCHPHICSSCVILAYVHHECIWHPRTST